MNESLMHENRSAELLVSEAANEFLERLGRGERPDIEEYAGRHPAVADVLRQVLPALEAWRSQGEIPVSACRHSDPAAGLMGCLGDYRILRELGRGGMGVVYEAEQVSLGRRVALKVLPFAAALEGKQLQRFKNEAVAAAHLNHPHIVPIYFVGCERSVHYYAMQFIDGQSLAEVLSFLRRATGEAQADSAGPESESEREVGHLADAAPTSPSTPLVTEHSAQSPAFFRTAARLGAQAAEALDHAHQEGVIHRDVKPRNLLLDATGHLWVADFGLARCRTAPGLTGTGDMVGTLRYMSPEQAFGKQGLIDHRSDIYALGATLYEALTLRPPYLGRDREELLNQIAGTSPPAPRQVNRLVPVALETVVLKAMAREPQDRYATARELAEDLQRFLEDRPVLASRPGLGELAARWAWRHRRAMAAGAAVLLLAVTGLVAATVLIWQARGQAETALKLARTHEAEARVQRQRAEANFHKALDGATQILLRLDTPSRGEALQGDRLRAALVEQGLRFFENFIDEGSPDPAVRSESAEAYGLMAGVYCSQHKCDEAQAMLRKQFALLQGLVDDYPEEPAYRRDWIWSGFRMGLVYTALGRPVEARHAFARTAELHRLALPHDLGGQALNRYAVFLLECPDTTLRDPALAVRCAEQAVARAPTDGKFWNTLGVARYRIGAWAESAGALKKALALGYESDAEDGFVLAMALWRMGDRPTARARYDKAVRQMDAMSPPPELWRSVQEEATALLDLK
jgi:serine/threonine protein kinase